MTDRRVSEDTAILGSGVATGDLFDLVDVSDTTDAASGTNKNITADEVAKFIAANSNVTGAFDASGAAATAQTNAEAYADGLASNYDAAGAAAAVVSDTAYDATTWNGVTGVAPSKNAVRDEMELKANLASPALTGTPTAPTATAGTDNTQVATTAYVDAVISDTAYNATTWDAVTGIAPSKNAVRDQLVLLAPLASPTFTGTPAAPTATSGTNTTQVATTAYVQGEIGSSIEAYDATILKSADIGSTVQGYDVDTLKADTGDQLTAGFDATNHAQGTVSSGTFTPNPQTSNFYSATNGGAHTLGVPTNPCSLVVEYTNNASAGTITTSGFTIVNGDALDTTNAHVFMLFITVTANKSLLTVVAMQ